jgi:hypothetical protein
VVRLEERVVSLAKREVSLTTPSFNALLGAGPHAAAATVTAALSSPAGVGPFSLESLSLPFRPYGAEA